MMNAETPQGPFCQSCTMPMAKPEDHGTDADGTANEEYCRYCYQNGSFTEPDLTVGQMTAKCAGIMRQMHVPEKQIERTKAFLPMLARWRSI
jgi:hypothetical protein